MAPPDHQVRRHIADGDGPRGILLHVFQARATEPQQVHHFENSRTSGVAKKLYDEAASVCDDWLKTAAGGK